MRFTSELPAREPRLWVVAVGINRFAPQQQAFGTHRQMPRSTRRTSCASMSPVRAAGGAALLDEQATRAAVLGALDSVAAQPARKSHWCGSWPARVRRRACSAWCRTTCAAPTRSSSAATATTWSIVELGAFAAPSSSAVGRSCAFRGAGAIADLGLLTDEPEFEHRPLK